MLVTDELRAFLRRLLGWNSDRNVEQALRSLDLALAHRAHLVLRGAGDLVPIASALHRRTFGPSRPFVVCDPRRGNTPASVRSPANHDRGLMALEAAAGGSSACAALVCLVASSRSLPSSGRVVPRSTSSASRPMARILRWSSPRRSRSQRYVNRRKTGECQDSCRVVGGQLLRSVTPWSGLRTTVVIGVQSRV